VVGKFSIKPVTKPHRAILIDEHHLLFLFYESDLNTIAKWSALTAPFDNPSAQIIEEDSLQVFSGTKLYVISVICRHIAQGALFGYSYLPDAN